MPTLLLNTIALEPNRWQPQHAPVYAVHDLIGPISGAGFHFVELWQNHVAGLTLAEVRNVSQQAGDHGLSFPVAGMYPTLDPAGADEQQRHLKEMEGILDRVLLLGCSVVKIFVGRKDRSQLSRQEYDTSVRSLAHLVRLASARRIVVAGEIHENTLFSTVESAKDVIRDVGDPPLRVCFQPLDFTDTEGTLAIFAAVREHVVHVHLQGRKAGTLSLLEDADIDYGRLMQTFAKSSYEGMMSIEFVKDCVVSTPEDFEFRKVMGNAGRDRAYLIALAKGCGLDLRV